MGDGKKVVEVDGGVFGSVLETKGDLRVAETGSGWILAEAAGTAAQRLLDLLAELAAGALEIAGDTGFVLTEFAADLGEGVVRAVIKAEAFFVAGIEQAERNFQRAPKEGDKLTAMGVAERSGAVGRDCGLSGR